MAFPMQWGPTYAMLPSYFPPPVPSAPSMPMYSFVQPGAPMHAYVPSPAALQSSVEILGTPRISASQSSPPQLGLRSGGQVDTLPEYPRIPTAVHPPQQRSATPQPALQQQPVLAKEIPGKPSAHAPPISSFHDFTFNPYTDVPITVSSSGNTTASSISTSFRVNIAAEFTTHEFDENAEYSLRISGTSGIPDGVEMVISWISSTLPGLLESVNLHGKQKNVPRGKFINSVLSGMFVNGTNHASVAIKSPWAIYFMIRPTRAEAMLLTDPTPVETKSSDLARASLEKMSDANLRGIFEAYTKDFSREVMIDALMAMRGSRLPPPDKEKVRR